MTSGKPVSSNAKSLHMHKTWSVASDRDNHFCQEIKHRKERREAIIIPTFPRAPFIFPRVCVPGGATPWSGGVGWVAVTTRRIVDPNSELVSFCCKLPLQSHLLRHQTPINCHLRPASTSPPCHFCNRQHIIGVRIRCPTRPSVQRQAAAAIINPTPIHVFGPRPFPIPV